jgi:hypothetical protein
MLSERFPQIRRTKAPYLTILQSSFVPLNVEIESESEDEIDDSKEIQVCSSSVILFFAAIAHPKLSVDRGGSKVISKRPEITFAGPRILR